MPVKTAKKVLRPCQVCRSWKGCTGYDWYSQADIRFCRNQCLWMIEHLELLKEGVWPGGDPHPTGYTKAPGKPGIKSEAKFIRPCEYAGELEARLNKTGRDGLTLLKEYRNENMTKAARDALNYICGWKRKRMRYSRWLIQRNYRYSFCKDLT